MGVSNLNAEMLLANYFSSGMLATYAKALGKSDKGGAATLAERIAREWAKPSFAPPASTTTAAAKPPQSTLWSHHRHHGCSDDERDAIFDEVQCRARPGFEPKATVRDGADSSESVGQRKQAGQRNPTAC